ncbi:MAG: four helix bundle protein [Bacteroidota bacterium]
MNNSKGRRFNSKEEYAEWFKSKTKQFAIDIIKFFKTLQHNKATNVISYQLIKSATSTAANYRAVCRARSDKELYSKLCIVVEEADESVFWLEMIIGAELANDTRELNRLMREADEILRVSATAKKNAKKRLGDS